MTTRDNRSKDHDKQTEIRDYYDQSDYFESFADHYGARDSKFNRYARKYIFSIHYPHKGQRIVDLGCGWGNISLALMRLGFDVYGIDYSEQSVDLCRRGAIELGLDPDRFVCADVAGLPFPDGAFDVIYTAGLVEHLYPDVFVDFVREARRILRSEGILVIGTPNPQHFLELLKRNNIILKEDVTHVDYKTMSGLTQTLTGNGFDVLNASYYQSHLPVVSWIERAFMHVMPPLRRRICIRARKREAL